MATHLKAKSNSHDQPNILKDEYQTWLVLICERRWEFIKRVVEPTCLRCPKSKPISSSLRLEFWWDPCPDKSPTTTRGGTYRIITMRWIYLFAVVNENGTSGISPRHSRTRKRIGIEKRRQPICILLAENRIHECALNYVTPNNIMISSCMEKSK